MDTPLTSARNADNKLKRDSLTIIKESEQLALIFARISTQIFHSREYVSKLKLQSFLI